MIINRFVLSHHLIKSNHSSLDTFSSFLVWHGLFRIENCMMLIYIYIQAIYFVVATRLLTFPFAPLLFDLLQPRIVSYSWK